MCLYVVNDTCEMTAREDIFAYKTLNRNHHSVWQDFEYLPNTTYRLKKKLVVETYSFSVAKGFHAFTTLECARYYRRGYEIIVKVIIPKGAKYYVGKDDDIVSTSIRTSDLKPVRRTVRM